MRVCFLLPDLERSGGTSVVVGYAIRLAQREGWTADIVLTDARDGDLGSEVPVRTFEEARGARYDVAIATWWETAQALFELEAERRVCFLQSFEQRFYRSDELVEQLRAEAILALPVDFIVVARWMRELLLALRPDAHCVHAPNGVDKEAFGNRRAAVEGPLRILVEGQPSLWFKGVHEALAVVGAMKEDHWVTLLALDPREAAGLPADRVVGALDPPDVAALYADTDVLLKLSRVESLGLPPLEAAHAGVPSVVWPYTGHEEYLRDGENGLVAGFDDLPGTARLLDRLARDSALLERLSRGALETSERWPSASDAADGFADALESIVAAPPREADARLLQRTLAFYGEVGRDQAGRLRYTEDALASARAHVDEISGMLAQRSAELVELKSTRAYKAHRAVARLKGGR